MEHPVRREHALPSWLGEMAEVIASLQAVSAQIEQHDARERAMKEERQRLLAMRAKLVQRAEELRGEDDSLSQRIESVLSRYEDPLTAQDIAAILDVDSPGSVRTTLARMYKDDRINRVGRGLYTSLQKPGLDRRKMLRGFRDARAERSARIASDSDDVRHTMDPAGWNRLLRKIRREEEFVASVLSQTEVIEITPHMVHLAAPPGSFPAVELTSHAEHFRRVLMRALDAPPDFQLLFNGTGQKPGGAPG